MQVKSQLYPSTRVKIRDSKDSGALKSLMNDNNRHIEIVKISAQQEDAMNGGGCSWVNGNRNEELPKVALDGKRSDSMINFKYEEQTQVDN
ncbi:hypothetical protein Pst134EA_000413 [Puccinia striiformis f. sp. tritici]|uniref:hypothetical protein n=1 Tax=Puccinia striiformis f. sp. tritici TaxID=168172 RepID=UPI00200835F9|nr:hypothetical protein Pst134EA_000413 [Puccinia striiformis f. sp. tritici]KAH9473340.1 hypothetical protein Pst134EA_000413 [Puccinia striiformis f. sp. tritici]